MSNRKIRVRSKRLEQISADRLALALWLMARDYTDGETSNPPMPTTDGEKSLDSTTEAA